MFGPYPAPFTMPMTNRSGFTPVEGAHLQYVGTAAAPATRW